MYDLLKGKSRGLKEDLTKFVQQLVRTPSPSLEEGRVARLVEREMRKGQFANVFRDRAGNVVAVNHGREAEPTILLTSHMDTVLPKEDDPWHLPAWSGEIADGRLHGVGAADCKAGLAAQIYSGRLLARALLPLRGNLIVAATVAEENGCSVGLRTLLERTLPELSLTPTFAVLGEPTNLNLYYGHNGWFELDIRVEAVDRLETAQAAEMIHDEFARAGVFGTHSGAPQTMIVHHPRFAESPTGRRATIHMARRLSPTERAGDVASQIKHTAALAVQSVGSVAVDVDVIEERQQLYNGTTSVVRHVTHAWETDPFNPLLTRSFEALAAGGCKAAPGKWKLGRLGMGTGGGLLVNEFSVPTIGYGPGSEDLAHAPDESVELAKIYEAAYGNALIVHSLIGVPVCGWTSDFDEPWDWG